MSSCSAETILGAIIGGTDTCYGWGSVINGKLVGCIGIMIKAGG